MTEEAALSLQSAAFTPGRTLGTSFGVLWRNLFPFLSVALIISLPYIAFQTWLDIQTERAAATASASNSLAGANYGMIWAQTLTFALVQAALTYGAVADLRGERASIGECFRKGIGRSGHIVSGAMKYGLLLGLATLLLIIPGVLLYLRWWVFIPAMVVENLDSTAAFERSKVLTSGRRWTIFALAALIFAVQIVTMFGLLLVADGLAADIAITLLVVLFTTFTSVVAAVGYYHLRVEKEGIIIDDIAKVFD
jgi:hypothetical protein